MDINTLVAVFDFVLLVLALPICVLLILVLAPSGLLRLCGFTSMTRKQGYTGTIKRGGNDVCF